MKIRNDGTTSSKSNQLQNIITLRWEIRDITIQLREIHDRKSKFNAFAVKVDGNINAIICSKFHV